MGHQATYKLMQQLAAMVLERKVRAFHCPHFLGLQGIALIKVILLV